MRIKNRVLLILPPVTRPKDFSSKRVRVSPFFPMGIAYLAAALEKTNDFEVFVLDALMESSLEELEYKDQYRYGLTDEAILQKINEIKPDIIGISCLFSAMEWDSINIAQIAKEANSQIMTILGGPHAGANGIEILNKSKACDFVLIGEGEENFIDLAKEISSNKNKYRFIDGIIYRDEQGAVIKQPKTKYISNLDEIAFPARHLFDMNKYLDHAIAHSSYKNKPFTTMLSSRGCPAKCTFCAIANHWGKAYRFRSAKNVLDEIEFLINTYGIKEIHFEDDNLTSDCNRALEIFNGMIERNFNISWTVPSGMALYTLDDELLEKMKESGCYSISLAIENGNQQVLSQMMHKPVKLEKVPNVVKKIRELDMEVRGFFILGFPGETKKTMEETIVFARELELDWAHFFIFAPLPGTEIYKKCLEKGYLRKEDFDPLRSFYEPVVKTEEFDQAYLRDLRERAIIDVNFENNANLLKYDIEKAIRSFRQVVDLYPHFDFANYHLALAYLKKGDKASGLEYLNKTFKLNPEYKEVKKLLESLS